MKINFTCVLLITSLLFASCSHVYEPALYHQDIAYMPKPASFDSIKTANYVSGGLNMHSNSNLNDFLVSGQVNLSRGHAFNNFDIAYGAFGEFGDYENSAISNGQPNYFSDKFFGAVGGRFSANAFFTSGRTDYRFVGIEMAYSHEFGSYANFRQYLGTQQGYFADQRTNLFTIGLTSEIYFHSVNDSGFQHGIRGFLGTTVGYNNLDNTFYKNDDATNRMFRNIFPKVSYFITVKSFFGTVETGEEFFIRFGYKF